MPLSTTEPAVDQVPETRPAPTVDQIIEAVRSDAAQSPEYLDESVVPFGGE